MLKFVDNKGKKVMEMKDNGVILVEDAKLKEELSLQEGVQEKEETKEDGK